MYASNSHSYTHLILALGIVREPTVWGLLLQNILAYMTLAWLLTVQRMTWHLSSGTYTTCMTWRDGKSYHYRKDRVHVSISQGGYD